MELLEILNGFIMMDTTVAHSTLRILFWNNEFLISHKQKQSSNFKLTASGPFYQLLHNRGVDISVIHISSSLLELWPTQRDHSDWWWPPLKSCFAHRQNINSVFREFTSLKAVSCLSFCATICYFILSPTNIWWPSEIISTPRLRTTDI